MNRKEKVNSRSAGFVDSDLMTDEHDQVMVWLYENINEIMEEIGHKVKWAEWEKPLPKGQGQYKTIVGYADLMVRTETGEIFIFEVKSKIKNVGETIRQIRQYQFYVGSSISKFVIVCPSDKFKNILEGQGIDFLRCPIFDKDEDDEPMGLFGRIK